MTVATGRVLRERLEDAKVLRYLENGPSWIKGIRDVLGWSGRDGYKRTKDLMRKLKRRGLVVQTDQGWVRA